MGILRMEDSEEASKFEKSPNRHSLWIPTMQWIVVGAFALAAAFTFLSTSKGFDILCADL